MPPTRVGDTWTVDFAAAGLSRTAQLLRIGVLPTETYHAIATCQAEWTDGDTPPDPGYLSQFIQLDLDGFVLPEGADPETVDLAGLAYQDGPPQFDSNMSIQHHQDVYTSPSGTLHVLQLVQQSVFDNLFTNTIMAFTATGGDAPVSIIGGRIVFTVVTSR